MTAALEGGEWSAARPGRILPLGKTPYPFYRRLVGPQGRTGRAENLVATGIRSRTVQPVVGRYTDWITWPIYIYTRYVHIVHYDGIFSLHYTSCKLHGQIKQIILICYLLSLITTGGIHVNICNHSCHNVRRSSCRVPVIFVRLKKNLIFRLRFSNRLPIWNFTKTRSAGNDLFHVEV